MAKINKTCSISVFNCAWLRSVENLRTSEKISFTRTQLYFWGPNGGKCDQLHCALFHSIFFILFICPSALKQSSLSKKQVCQCMALADCLLFLLATFPFLCLFIASLSWTSCRPAFACYMCAIFVTVFGPMCFTEGYF